MITLNTLLEITDGDTREITVHVPLTPRLKATIRIDLSSSAEMDDLSRLYGDFVVTSMGPDDRRYGLSVDIMYGPAKAGDDE